MTFKRTITDEELTRRQTELAAVMREIYNRKCALAALQLQKEALRLSVRHALYIRGPGRSDHDRKRNAANSRAYRARRKTKPKPDPYMGRKYDDVKVAA